VRLYNHVGVIAPGLSLCRRRALVAAARSLEMTTSVDEAIDETEAELQSLSGSVPSRVDARRRVAETAADLDAKRERVATIRGRLQETNDGSIQAEYRSAIRELSEAETEHAAAKEALDNARNRARNARDTRDRRLRLEDRLRNLERTARAELRTAVSPAVEAALSALPSRDVASFESADPVSTALALVRTGRIETPVMLACRRFPDRGAAERWLKAPVYRI
jgi:hypothetical protein